MELAASSIALLMNVLVLMSVHDGLSLKTNKSERTFPRIVPSKLLVFEYSPLNVTCEGFFNDMTKWRVLRNIAGWERTSCNKNGIDFGPCHIPLSYPADSGEYWCESEDRRRSERVKITVTEAANVILESPVRPVMVGDNVTLRCIENKKQTAPTKIEFYKDGVSAHTSSTGEMNFHNISVSDQGRYKCKISDNESKESLLQVRAVFLECPDQPVMEGENVTLFCRDKMAASNYTSFFYKDNKMIWKTSTGKLTLNKVSKSDEGVYKCKTSEDRESEEQWLAVRGELPNFSVSDVSGLSPSKAFSFIALVALLLVLLVFGFIYKKYKGTYNRGRGSGHQAEAHEQATVIYSQITEVDVNTRDLNAMEGDMYCTVNKAKKKTKRCGQSSDVQGELYSTVDKKKKRKHQGQTNEVLYSAVKKNKGNKPGDSRSGNMEEDTLYSLIR